MTRQMTLGEALKEIGTTTADLHADTIWKQLADAAIDRLAATGKPFTADDIRDLGVPDPSSPKAWGARMLSAAKSGRIRRVGYQPSRRPSVHAHPVAVWVGA
jgi:hypothetical protein